MPGPAARRLDLGGQAVSHDVLSARIVGVAPLLMRSARFADPLDEYSLELERLTRKRIKTMADHEQIAKVEWFGGLWTDGGRPCIPGDAVEAALVAAARTRKAGGTARAAILCPRNVPIEHDGAADLNALWSDTRFRLRASVRVNGRRTMRTRPKFEVWAAALDLHFLPTLLNRNDVLELLRIAGDRIALGDWRPRFGRFTVEPMP
jgi:hypothetical protein